MSSNTYGDRISLTLFGESHGVAIGAVLDGLKAGVEVDEEFIALQMEKRRAKGKISTKRQEADKVKIVSGVFEGKTTGTPITIIIENEDTRSKDYSKTKSLARPSHADYTGFVKYDGFNDYRGGGHFSGRITAPIVAAGAILLKYLMSEGIYICTHISECGGVRDREFLNLEEDYKILSDTDFAVLGEGVEEKMRARIEEVAAVGDSVGGVLQTAIFGLPAGVGDPWFDTFEGVLAKGLFAIPGIKGVEFGAGFKFKDMQGSVANDPFTVENGKVKTLTNNNGGINGGISNGMPVIVNCAVKPTPSIYKEQDTIDFEKMENAKLQIQGRHDPAIIHRARVVADSITALAVADMLYKR
ncbi:MAG: chorismate synthase [Clostridia bacterium]|nr:chorismate synthase [Clostridia bacterium]